MAEKKIPIGYKFEIRGEILDTINKFLQMGVIAPAGAIEYLQMKLEKSFTNDILYSEEKEGGD